MTKTAEITPAKTVVRLGPIRLRKLAQLALAEPAGAAMGASPR